ncbi:hypothetical protein IB229_06315 [Pseudomonas sp. PDM14]|uniref:hypothetical protein n=1 Tax=Pseudomonas sp. PDM14 TaxID=2769288 RepID=UPI00178573B3|nr:hypothetical protein [Pseudomonas sp. PDM14]MBD9482574.1 hypothetical protein [Pseudomonas sp. PDM14]
MSYLSDRHAAVSGSDSLDTAHSSSPCAALTQELPRSEAVFPRKYRWPYELPTFQGGPLHQAANRHSAV